jgi:hypothetical protein
VHASAISQPHAPLGVVGSAAHGDCERLHQDAFLECAAAQVVSSQVQRGLGGALIQQWHLWLVGPPPSVCEMVWRDVGCHLGN